MKPPPFVCHGPHAPHDRSLRPRAWLAAAALPFLAACAGLQAPPSSVPLNAPAAFDNAWYSGAAAPSAASGLSPGDRPGAPLQWWAQWQDPALLRLIARAQEVSPDMASARTRIAESRAQRVAASAALGPTLDGTGQGSRGRQDLATPVRSSAQLGLDAGWEIDLFGGNRAAADAAMARLEGAQALAYGASVSVAAEVAQQVLSWRYCQRALRVAEADAKSRAEVARLTNLRAEAGFDAPADAALARASAAQGRAEQLRQSAQCEVELQGLSVLTAQTPSALRAELATDPADPPDAALSWPAALPTQVLAQRPDVLNAARNVLAASADVRSAKAQAYPRLSVSGSIARAANRSGGITTTGSVWSIGPLQITVPLFDGGQRRANTAATEAGYEEAVLQFGTQVRQAVSELETALINLQSTADRLADAQAAAAGYQASLDAAVARQRAGLGSLFELEDARRTALSAQTAVLGLRQERANAWIALYRAAGGGWQAPGPTPQ
jgi:multidrug efflux system outer membrane protein